MSGFFDPKWWTNKHLFWFAAATWIVAVLYLLHEKRDFDRGGAYRVTTRYYRSGLPISTNVAYATGQSLAEHEENVFKMIRLIGIVAFGAAIVSTTVIVQRIGRGEDIFKDAFK